MADSPNPPAHDNDEPEVFAFPTTLGQQRFWSLDSLQPGNAALNMPLAARLQGKLNREAAQFAIDEIMRRHEILRTSFQYENDELAQVVGPFAQVQIRWTDLHDVPPHAFEKKTRELMEEEGALPFDLAKGPLLRAGVVSFSASEHLLLLSMHHIGSDGWSNGILIREFAEHYTRFIAGGQAPADLPLQYADYAIWQKDWLAGPSGQAQHDYWQAQLGNTIPVLNLPTDQPRGPKPTFTGNIHSLLLPQELTEAIRTNAQLEGATPFMFVLAAYIMLLHRYSNRCEFVVGSPAACRNQTELEDMIGLFANPVMFHPRIDPSMTFRDLLLHVREITLASFANQEYPFELIGEDLRTEDDHRGVPWLQAYFVFQKAFMQPQHMPELQLTPLRSISSGAMFEWMLGVIERKEGMRLQLEYCTHLFELKTIDRAIHHLQAILNQGALDMDFRIGQLVLDAPPALEIAASATSSAATLLQQITTAFGDRDNAILIEHSNHRLSLGQLKTTSTRLVSMLGRGETKALRVGISTEDPIEAIPAVIAVLSAGHSAVCLPKPVKGSQSPTAGVDLIWSHKAGQFELISTRPASRAPLAPAGWDIHPAKGGAALITPIASKYEAHEHAFPVAHLLTHVQAVGQALGLQPNERVFSSGSLGNLLGWEETLSTLTAGSTIVRGENNRRALRLRDTAGSSVWMVPTAAWQEWLRTAPEQERSKLSTVRMIALDRDPLSPLALATLQKAGLARASVFLRHQLQILGATIAIKKLSDTSAQAGQPLATIGRPVSGCIIDVVDARGVATPHGVPGRLRLQAPWLDQSSLAVAGPTPEYISDDWVRRLENERLLWLGRSEDLARTSGFTLELAQLRQIVCSHPNVWDATVVSKANATGNSVVLNVVPIPHHNLSNSVLVQFIRQRVPAYMVPSVVLHDNTPLDRSGRWDYQALREATPTQAATAAPHASKPEGEPAVAKVNNQTLTPTEEKLSKIFSNVLRQPSIDIERSFFDLGGHSLLAVRLFAGIEKEFGKRLPLATLLARPSVRLLATQLEGNVTETSHWSCLVPMAIEGDGPKFFCVHGAGGNVLLYRDLARHMHPHVRFYGLQAQGLDGESPCLTKIEDMAALYLKEIQREQPVGPYYIGGYCLGGNIIFEMARLLVERGHQIGLVAMLDTYNLTKSLHKHTFLGKLNKWRQKADFHVDTLLELSREERVAYLSEKKRMARELARGKVAAVLRDLKGSNAKKGKRSPVAFVQDANHVALRSHHPQFNPAPLTLFQPRKNYSFFPDPNQGWREVVGGPFETVRINANPHAMLMQPFVRELAAALVQRLQPPACKPVSPQK